jgi:hypothetical protein
MSISEEGMLVCKICREEWWAKRMWEGPFAHLLLDLFEKHYEDLHPFELAVLRKNWEEEEHMERLKKESPRAYALLKELAVERKRHNKG